MLLTPRLQKRTISSFTANYYLVLPIWNTINIYNIHHCKNNTVFTAISNMFMVQKSAIICYHGDTL